LQSHLTNKKNKAKIALGWQLKKKTDDLIIVSFLFLCPFVTTDGWIWMEVLIFSVFQTITTENYSKIKHTFFVI